MELSPQEIEELLGRPLVGVLGTVGPDGRAHLAPIWYVWRDDGALMLTARASRKWRNIEDRRDVSLCVDTKDPPYRGAVVQGTAWEIEADYRDCLLTIATHYLGEEDGRRYVESSERGDPEESVVFKLTPSRIVSWKY